MNAHAARFMTLAAPVALAAVAGTGLWVAHATATVEASRAKTAAVVAAWGDASAITVSERAPRPVMALALGALTTLAALWLVLWLTRRLTALGQRDVALACARLHAIGNRMQLPPPPDQAARLAEVAALERDAALLAERFEVFAGAQERALEAREAARRTRGLLFASVSHDLKSPLNAILGFADLIDLMDLAPEQRESLDLVRSRGRELLALIEAILDAARIEAGQLDVVRRPTPVTDLVREIVIAARQLAPDAGPLAVEVDAALTTAMVDLVHASRALGALAAHALSSSDANGEVGLRISQPAPGDRLRIEIEHAGEPPPSARERLSMLAHRTGPRGRGMALILSLAARVIELHGGNVEVEGVDEGAPLVRAWLPMTEGFVLPKTLRTIPPLSARARPR